MASRAIVPKHEPHVIQSSRTANGVTNTMRIFCLTLLFLFTLGASAWANWFNKSEEYLAGCRDEAVRKYYKDPSSADVRRHIHLCMIAHGYAFKASCNEKGWLDPDCYRLKYKTEGR
jgi:hypothetical protein